MKNHCCEKMQKQVEYTCANHPNRQECPDCLVEYFDKTDEYGLFIHDGGSAFLPIDFCPWCGEKL